MKKVAIITGGSSGIGRALVYKYSSEGYAVVFTGRNQKKLNEVSRDLEKYERDFLALKLDASSDVDNHFLIHQTIEKYKKIDVLVCNAGISMRCFFEDLNIDVFKQVMNINFYGAIYVVKHALPFILASRGSIVGMSSINGSRSTPGRSAYSSSKFAMEGFFETLRTEVMKRGVHVLVVRPGFTASNIRNSALMGNGSKQGESPRDETRMMTSEEVALYTFNAQKKRKRTLVLTLQGKMAVVLNKFFPRIMDKIVYTVMKKEQRNTFK